MGILIFLRFFILKVTAHFFDLQNMKNQEAHIIAGMFVNVHYLKMVILHVSFTRNESKVQHIIDSIKMTFWKILSYNQVYTVYFLYINTGISWLHC